MISNSVHTSLIWSQHSAKAQKNEESLPSSPSQDLPEGDNCWQGEPAPTTRNVGGSSESDLRSADAEKALMSPSWVTSGNLCIVTASAFSSISNANLKVQWTRKLCNSNQRQPIPSKKLIAAAFGRCVEAVVEMLFVVFVCLAGGLKYLFVRFRE